MDEYLVVVVMGVIRTHQEEPLEKGAQLSNENVLLPMVWSWLTGMIISVRL